VVAEIFGEFCVVETDSLAGFADVARNINVDLII